MTHSFDASHPVETYLNQLSPEMRSTFTESQLEAVKELLQQSTTAPTTVAKARPKLVDLRFVMDLMLARYYVVLMIGPDRRNRKRSYTPHPLSRIGNAIAAGFLLLSLNVLITATLVLGLYLLKSALGLDFFPGHLGQPES